MIKREILLVLLCLPAPAHAQAPPRAPAAPETRYVLFIHSGPKNADDIIVRRLALTLVKRGYSVREPKNDQDKVGGPGVEYFADEAKGKAQDVADMVNDFFAQNGQAVDPAKKLHPRKMRGNSLPNYIGVWLY